MTFRVLGTNLGAPPQIGDGLQVIPTHFLLSTSKYCSGFLDGIAWPGPTVAFCCFTPGWSLESPLLSFLFGNHIGFPRNLHLCCEMALYFWKLFFFFSETCTFVVPCLARMSRPSFGPAASIPSPPELPSPRRIAAPNRVESRTLKGWPKLPWRANNRESTREHTRKLAMLLIRCWTYSRCRQLPLG